MSDPPDPFEDVRPLADGGFSLPELKWRELLFVGALRAHGDGFVRDPTRPLPPFRLAGLFPEGRRLRAERHADRVHVSVDAGLSAADPALAGRLEAAEAAGARLAVAGQPGAAALDVAGGVAAFFGAGSPLSHALGLGMVGPVSDADLGALEQFYAERGSDTEINVCPLAHDSLLALTAERGYRLVGLEHLLACADFDGPAPAGGAAASAVTIEAVDAADRDAWSDLVARGFSGQEDEPAEDLATGRILFQSSRAFWARVEGRLAGAAALGSSLGVAHLFADSTLRSFRGRGIQSALIRHRLEEGRRAGCTLAIASVQPGSPSHRNYGRAGFQVMYTRAVLTRRSRG